MDISGMTREEIEWELAMGDPELDVEALNENMDRVKRASAVGHWRQGSWVDLLRDDQKIDAEFCGTAGCFAGHYVMSQGFSVVETVGNWGDLQLRNPVTGAVIPENRVMEAAMVGLGLTPHQARVLFHADNSLEALQRMVDALSQGKRIVKEMP